MKRYLLLTLIPVFLIGTLFIPSANADNPIITFIQQIIIKLMDHEERITAIEETISITIVAPSSQVMVTNGLMTQALITENCEIIDAGEQVVRGWCPQPNYQTYLIEDIRVLGTTLVLLNGSVKLPSVLIHVKKRRVLE